MKCSLEKPQRRRIATRPSSRNYNTINPGVGENWNKNNTHGHHENLAEQAEGPHELRRKNSKGLGLQWFYISNTRIGGDHVPSIIQTMHESSSIVTCVSNNSNHLNMILIKTMHKTIMYAFIYHIVNYMYFLS